MNDGHVVEIQSTKKSITRNYRNVQNEAAESEQNVEEKTIDESKKTKRFSTLVKDHLMLS